MSHSEPAEVVPPKKKQKSLGDMLNARSVSAPRDVRETSGSVHREVQLYSSLPTLADKTADPLDWWRDNALTFPSLAKLARKYLCVPATSVPSERAFSAAGNIVTAKRNSLKPTKVNELCFLAANLDV